MSTLNQDDKIRIRAILVNFYGNQANNWNITERVYLELVKIIQKSGQCTTAMHFVPRPFLLGNPINWLRKEIIKSVLRFLTTDENKYYVLCMKGIAYGHKHRIVMAVNGA